MSAIKKLGNFTVGFDNNSGLFFVKDNLDAQVQIGTFFPSTFSTIFNNILYADDNRLTFSKGISNLLESGGAINTSGYYGARILIAANVIQVPEPSLIFGIIGVSLSCIASRRSKKNNVVAGYVKY